MASVCVSSRIGFLVRAVVGVVAALSIALGVRGQPPADYYRPPSSSAGQANHAPPPSSAAPPSYAVPPLSSPLGPGQMAPAGYLPTSAITPPPSPQPLSPSGGPELGPGAIPTGARLPVPALAEPRRLQLPGQDPVAQWQRVVETIGWKYQIDRQEPPQLEAGRWRPGRLYTVPAGVQPTGQSFGMTSSGPAQRRWLVVTLQPNPTGAVVEMSAQVEMQDRLLGVDPQAATWRFVGRDAAEEQSLADDIGRQFPGAAPSLQPPPIDAGSKAAEPFSASTFDLDDRSFARRTFDDVRQDYKNFYSVPSLVFLTASFGWGAIEANTTMDQKLFDFYQNQAHYQSGVHAFKYFGEGSYLIPAYAAFYVVGKIFDERPVGALFGDYGERSLRGLLVGGPAMLLMQGVTGAGRPGEHPWGSDWVFFNDNNGVSGHSFIGGLTFITAAKMAERPVVKAAFYGLSIMPGLSRVNDGAHYPSQVFLGWMMAYAAATAVDNTQRANNDYRLIPYFTGQQSGMMFELRY